MKEGYRSCVQVEKQEVIHYLLNQPKGSGSLQTVCTAEINSQEIGIKF